MLKISDFSRLAQVPVATLRYYDQMDLLKPAKVDPFTDYRYYSVDQLPRLNRILALKDLGFSLEQITQLLKRDLRVDEMRGMLLMRQADAEREVQEAQVRLARVAARLQEIEQEGLPSRYDLVTKAVAPQWILSTRQIVGHAVEMNALCWQLHESLRAWANQHQIKVLAAPPAPHLVNLYHNTEYTEVDLDVEAALFIQPIRPTQMPDFGTAPFALQVRELEGAATVVSGIHQGSMAALGQLIKAMLIWISNNHYSPVGPARELHLTPRQSSHSERVVEIQIPVQLRE